MRNRRFTSLSILALLLCLSTTSCTQDESNSGLGSGSFSLSVKTNSEVVPVLKSTTTTTFVPNEDDFAIKLINEDGEITKEWSSITNIPQDATFEIGNYALQASYNSIENEGFTTPFYYGETSFTIRDRETTPVDVMCTLGHVKLTLQYSETFCKYFSNYETTVQSSNNGKEIVFAKNETRDAYIRPGDINIKMRLTKPNGISANYEPTKIIDAKAREHYVVKFDVSESVGMALLTITFDDKTLVEPVSIDISDEAMVAPAPYILLEGVNSGETLHIQECDVPENNLLGAAITARGGMAGCTLKTGSAYLLSQGFPAEVDLANPTAEQQSAIEKFGLEIKGFGNTDSKMGYINFAALTPSLQITENGETDHTFTITARDINGKVSDPVSFTIHNTLLKLSISDINDVMLGSKAVDVPVYFDGSDATLLQIIRHTSNGNETIPCTILSNEGNNYILRAAIDVKNEKQTLQVSYANRRLTDIKDVNIIVPSYTLSYNDYDIWGSHITMQVTADDEQYQEVIEEYITFYTLTGSEWEQFTPTQSDNNYSVSDLTPGTTYEIKTSCLADASDLELSSILNITTEAALSLPNHDFEDWTQWFSETINKGGRYGAFMGWKQETQNLQSSNPNHWATVNTKTVPTNPKTKNTWYMIPSTLPTSGLSGNGVLLRNVAWDNNGSTPPEGSWGAFTQSLASLSAPTIANRSAGKLFLGSYSYDHNTGAEVYNEGYEFTSRPTKLCGYYKYIAKGSDNNGIANITIEHRTAGGEVITLATTKYNLEPTSIFAYFEIPVTYTDVTHKATHIKIMFASSDKASYNQQEESSNITTVNELSQAIAVGSELYIDNITLQYK